MFVCCIHTVHGSSQLVRESHRTIHFIHMPWEFTLCVFTLVANLTVILAMLDLLTKWFCKKPLCAYVLVAIITVS